MARRLHAAWTRSAQAAIFAFGVTATQYASATILPPNNLYLEDDINRKDANLTEAQFNSIVDEVINLYVPVVAAHGAVLTAQKAWTDTTVNAYAQQEGTSWYVKMFGGLARRPEVTPDGFAMVVCHELGHHLGGFAFYGASDWAASEGESDYFATQSCARRLWGPQAERNAASRAVISGTPKTKCDQFWSTVADQNLCYRTAIASQSLAVLLAALGGETVNFDTPSAVKVTETSVAHPPAQCRLDTYFNGALCPSVFDWTKIPGRNHPDGQLSRRAEVDAMVQSCMGYTRMGARPRCWFKPTVNSLVDVADFRVSEISGNGDGIIDPGEVYEASAQLSNIGPDDYASLQSHLTTTASWIQMASADSDVPALASQGSAWQTTPFRFQIAADAPCGSTLPLVVNVADQTFSDSFAKDLQVGRIISSAPVATATAADIPDNSDTGVVSTAAVDRVGTWQGVSVAVDITHPYVGDLIVTLVAPDGKETALHNREGGGSDNLVKTFDVALSGSESRGSWSLKVQDKAAADVGRVNSWSISFKSYQCSNP